MILVAFLATVVVAAPSQALIDAVTAGDATKTRALLEAGADVNARDEDGLSALALAARSGHADVAAVLVELGADIDARTETEVTALMFAARQGDPDTARVLIDGGADVNLETKYGGSALRIAVMENHMETTAMLLQAGADPAKVEGPETALTRAIREKRDGDVILMIATGSEVTAYALVVGARDGSTEMPAILEDPEAHFVGARKKRPGAPVRVGRDVAPPTKIKDAAPIYPDNAKRGRVQGTVVLEAIIDTKGNVAHIEILESIPELDQAAIDAVEQWKFEPTILDGVPVPIWVTVTVRFRLS